MTLGYDDTGQPQSLIDLRPFDLSDILDGTIKVYRNSPLVFIGILAILVSVPTVITQGFGLHVQNRLNQSLQMSMTGGGPDEMWSSVIDETFIPMAILSAIAMLFMFFLGPLAQGAVVHAISETILGRPTSIRESLAKVFNPDKATNVIVAQLLWGLILVGLITLIYVMVAVFFFMSIPAVTGSPGVNILFSILSFFGIMFLFSVFQFLYIKFMFIPQAVMLDNVSAIDALKRSFNLSTGYWWRTFGLWFLVNLIIGIISGLLGQGAGLVNMGLATINTIPAYVPVAIGGVILTIIYLVIQPIMFIAQTMLYYDLRIRKEGFDLLMLASDLADDSQGVDLRQDVDLTP